MTKPKAFITSVEVRPSNGPHEYVAVWIRGQNVGTLCVGQGDGERLALVLRGCRCLDGFLDRHGEHRLGCPLVGLSERAYFAARQSKDHPTAEEEGLGAPAPSREDASKAGEESRPVGVPPAAGAPPTSETNTTGPMAFAKCDRRSDVAKYDRLLAAEMQREAEDTLASLPPGSTLEPFDGMLPDRRRP